VVEIDKIMFLNASTTQATREQSNGHATAYACALLLNQAMVVPQ